MNNPNQFVSSKQKELGNELIQAFSEKNTHKIQSLVNRNAPVHTRLDYGLSIFYETDFVTALKIILGGTPTDPAPISSIQAAFNCDFNQAQALQNYTNDAFSIRKIIQQDTEHLVISVNHSFIQHLKTHAVSYRDSLGNCSLMSALSLIDDPKVDVNVLITDLLELGIDIDFRGYFGCNACMWSVIMLDFDRVHLFLDHESDINSIDDAGNSLLHWLAVTASFRQDKEDHRRVEKLYNSLIEREINQKIKNNLGFLATDYFSFT